MSDLYYSNQHGHFCRGTGFGHYKMPATWIDTDNEVWSEPYHLYGDARLGESLQSRTAYSKSEPAP